MMASPLLVADIGGTNARFGLAYIEANNHIHLEDIIVFSTNGYKNLVETIYDYLDQISEYPENASIAIAGPVITDEVNLTNGEWSFKRSEIADQVKMKTVKIINDFAANACALPFLDKQKLMKIGDGEINDKGNKLVLGPGTGMGVAGLTAVAEKWKVLTSEAGNIGFSPQGSLEFEISKIIGREDRRFPIEELLSGQGISDIYKAICMINGNQYIFKSPQEITRLALLENDNISLQTLNTFCDILGNFASDMAITFNATGGVYLAGGVLAKIKDVFIRSNFRERFEQNEKLQFVRKIPTYHILEEHPALIGAAGCFYGKFIE
jgi:glucokinase